MGEAHLKGAYFRYFKVYINLKIKVATNYIQFSMRWKIHTNKLHKLVYWRVIKNEMITVLIKKVYLDIYSAFKMCYLIMIHCSSYVLCFVKRMLIQIKKWNFTHETIEAWHIKKVGICIKIFNAWTKQKKTKKK